MRGKAFRSYTSLNGGGITPAYAGKRLTGETGSEKTLGSPPPMRGKVEQREQMQISIRITPAYAGKSRCDI